MSAVLGPRAQGVFSIKRAFKKLPSRPAELDDDLMVLHLVAPFDGPQGFSKA